MISYAGACGDIIRYPLGSLPGKLPCHPAPCNCGHFHPSADHHKTWASQVFKFIIYSSIYSSWTNLFPGTSLVFQPQKAPAYLGKPARVLCPVSYLASVPLQSGCQSICTPNLIIVKMIAPLSHVTWLEANGSFHFLRNKVFPTLF